LGIEYEIKPREDGKGTDLYLTAGREHIGTIFRVTVTTGDDEFEKNHNIITLWQGEKKVAGILWGATEAIKKEIR